MKCQAVSELQGVRTKKTVLIVVSWYDTKFERRLLNIVVSDTGEDFLKTQSSYIHSAIYVSHKVLHPY
jgi:hypothetical protein